MFLFAQILFYICVNSVFYLHEFCLFICTNSVFICTNAIFYLHKSCSYLHKLCFLICASSVLICANVFLFSQILFYICVNSVFYLHEFCLFICTNSVLIGTNSVLFAQILFLFTQNMFYHLRKSCFLFAQILFSIFGNSILSFAQILFFVCTNAVFFIPTLCFLTVNSSLFPLWYTICFLDTSNYLWVMTAFLNVTPCSLRLICRQTTRHDNHKTVVVIKLHVHAASVCRRFVGCQMNGLCSTGGFHSCEGIILWFHCCETVRSLLCRHLERPEPVTGTSCLWLSSGVLAGNLCFVNIGLDTAIHNPKSTTRCTNCGRCLRHSYNNRRVHTHVCKYVYLFFLSCICVLRWR